MACGCKQPTTRVRSIPTPNAVTAAAKVRYEVWRNGQFTGRRTDSLIAAQQLADRLGGEVRPA